MPFRKSPLGILLLVNAFSATSLASTIGESLSSEVMTDSTIVSHTRGVWSELDKTADETRDLLGVTIGEDGFDRHGLETDLLILPVHFQILGRNGNAAKNGGCRSDFVEREIDLGNSVDEIIPSAAMAEWQWLAWSGEFTEVGRSASRDQANLSPAARILV